MIERLSVQKSDDAPPRRGNTYIKTLLSCRWFRLAKVALCCLLAGAPGVAAAKSGTPAKHSPVTLSASDQAFKDAFDAMSAKNWPAFNAASAKVNSHHILFDYLQYWRLRGQLAAASSASAELDGAVRKFIARRPDLLTADLLRKSWMLELGKRGQWNELLAHLPHWIRRNDTRVFCQAGRARMAIGKPVGEEAINAFNKDRNLDEECGPLAQELVAAGVLDSSALRLRMWKALEVRDWRSAELLAGMLGMPPEDAELALRKPEQFLRAYASQNDKTSRAPSKPAAAPVTVTDAVITNKQNDALLIALTKFSRPKPLDTARWMESLAVHLRQTEQQFVWAQIAASAMREALPESYGYALKATDATVTDSTRQWLARAAMRQKDWRLLTHFIGQMSSQAQASPTWQYWRARALDAQGSKFGAHALLRQIRGRHHFYGELAAEELGDLIAPELSEPPPSPQAIAKVAQLPGVRRALKFYELGIQYQGNREWNFQVREMNDDRLLASARFACQQNLLERCISTAERTREKHDFSLRFIAPFRSELAAAAQSSDLDLAWVYGLIRQESRFATDARSSAGARGLMQIMPATGRWIAMKMGVQGHRSQHLYEPDTNLKFGTYYLKTVYDDLQSSPLLASAAYNAGPRRPRAWMSTLNSDVDGALFIEIMPIAQTRNYVKKVLLNTAYYASVFTGERQSLKSLLGKVPLTPFQETKIP